MEQTFGTHLRDGAQLAVRRDGTGERLADEAAEKGSIARAQEGISSNRNIIGI